MSSNCREFERYLEASPADAVSSGRFEEHVGRCAECRKQLAADRALSELFVDATPVRLSREFTSVLRSRLIAEAPASARRRVIVMRAYWLVAAAVSAVILLPLPDWHRLANADTWRAGLVVAVVCVTVPVYLLTHRSNCGLATLIGRTVSVAGRRAR